MREATAQTQWYDEVLAPLVESGFTLLTPNRRLARRIKAHWDASRAAAGLSAWPSLDIHPLQSWLQQRWRVAVQEGQLHAAVLIDDDQAHELWQLAIEQEQDSGGYRLIQVAPAARQAHQAREDLLRWCIDCDDPAVRQQFRLDEDCETWLAWRAGFERRMQRDDLVTTAQSVAALAALPAANSGPRLALLDFDDIPPLYRRCLEQLGCEVRELAPAGDLAPVSVICYPERRAELQAAARWGRELFRDQPEARIGIVLQDMRSERGPLEYLLRREFGCLGQDYASLPVNFSTGITLDRAPVVRDAMGLLSLCQGRVAIAEIVALLRSRFVPWEDATGASNAQLLHTLCDLGREHLDTADLRGLANRLQAEAQFGLGTVLLQVSQMRDLRNPAAPSTWVQRICDLLDLWRWPGSGPLDSLEYQQVELWYRTLEDFAGYDGFHETLSLEGALALLRRLLAARVSQPQTEDSRLQVLGPLEAAGQDFDYLWLCGMQAGQWPAPARPNPYIPMALQRAQGMPHATAEREWLYAANLMQQYRRGSGTLIASYAKQLDGVDDLPSPLLEGFDVEERDEPSTCDPLWRAAAAGATHEALPGTAPPLGDDEASGLRGGAALLQDQSRCPFSAFARRRLGARGPVEPEAGLSAAERGSILHLALKLLFDDINGSERLAQLSEGAEHDAIEAAVDGALQQVRTAGPQAAPAGWRELERQRLHGLLQQWLEVERQRDEFSVLLQEELRTLELEGLPLTLRVDRIDRLADGRELIIDYKSGRCSVQQWLGERPQSPQMPLYAVANDTLPAALSFAQVRDGDCAFVGAGASPAAPGVRIDIAKLVSGGWDVESWEQLNHRWSEQLRGLAREFIAGEAAVEPQKGACDYCDLGPLCRVGLEVELPA